jgi:hypothetical protein
MLTEIAVLFPMSTLANTSQAATSLRLQGNDSIQVASGGKVTVATESMMYVPDPAIFEWVSPTMVELKQAGFFDDRPKVVAEPSPAPAPSVAATPAPAPTSNQSNRP